MDFVLLVNNSIIHVFLFVKRYNCSNKHLMINFSLSRRGLFNIRAEILDNSTKAVNLSAIFVHENYKTNIVDDILSPEFNNIGES